MDGTNYLTDVGSAVRPMFVDDSGNGLLITGASASAVKGYAQGCLLIGLPDNKLYINTGSTTTATWTVVGSQS